MARIRLDRDMVDGGGTMSTPVVDEQTKIGQQRITNDEALLSRVQNQITKLQKKVDDAPLDLNKPVNKMTPEELKAYQKARVDAQRVEREDIQSGNNPDNPKPTEDPGPGMYWANYGGVWRKYKYVTNTVVNSKGGGGGGGGGDDSTTQSTNITLVSTETDEYGNVIGVYSDSSTKILIPSGKKYKSTVDEDAYSILESTFKDFGLEELVPEIKKFMDAGLGSNQAGVELRKTAAYTTRFKGNETRRASGLNVLSEAEYLALEDSYSQTLRAYGLQNYFGIDRKVKTASMADIIGNDISAIEFKDRIDTVVTRINNADPKIKNTLNAFYNITDTDLVKYFLNPKENLPKLQEKVTAAEIGTAALSQGLITDVNRATALAQMGITKEKAQEGYEAISGALPTTTKLSQIYGEEGINYTQATAEEEVFKQLESAKRKRLKLAEKEVGSFSGAAGLGRNALGTGKSSAF